MRPTTSSACGNRSPASQAVFARFLGVSRNTVRSWEQGVNTPSTMACRFLDEIRLNGRLLATAAARIGEDQERLSEEAGEGLRQVLFAPAAAVESCVTGTEVKTYQPRF